MKFKEFLKSEQANSLIKKLHLLLFKDDFENYEFINYGDYLIINYDNIKIRISQSL